MATAAPALRVHLGERKTEDMTNNLAFGAVSPERSLMTEFFSHVTLSKSKKQGNLA